SVGSTQIKTGAVRSSDIRDRSVGLRDISRAARASLRGDVGVPGPTGPAGPAGAPATKYFAAVSASGGLVRGNATNGGRAGGIGTYVVGFAESVSGCAFSATVGTTDNTVLPAGRAVVSDQSGKVGVQTYDAAGNPADLAFHLLVAC
ncbi:MAG: hypothetical protein HZB46_13245, partial [Solirubrobacterales bacterium]|nr:hypothetical protein [Solirubrobacterales bacterium]